MRVVDAMMSFPDILLAIALVGILGPSMLNVVLALTLVYTPRVARVVRASTLVVRELLFVEAARAVGVSTLPHPVAPRPAQPAVADPGAGVVHLRVRDPGRGGAVVPGRGRAARDSRPGARWSRAASSTRTRRCGSCCSPGLAIIVTALSLQLLGDGIRDLLDPRLRKSM
jgi:peptide/nickel transport system permease protein